MKTTNKNKKQSKGEKLALERIDKARLAGATILDLSGLGLEQLPSEIGQLTSLTELYLSDNQIGDFTALESLTNCKIYR